MLKLFAILALLSQPAMAQDSKQEFEADAQACDKAADFAKCFERDRMQRALTDHATKLVIEELGRRTRPYREAVGRDRATRSRAIVESSNQGAPTIIHIAKLPRLLRKRSSWGPKDMARSKSHIICEAPSSQIGSALCSSPTTAPC